MGRPIVCGVDGSEAGAAALATADWLAGRLGSEAIAIHALDPGPAGYRAHRSVAGASELAKVGEENALALLEEVVGQVRPRREPELRACYGDPPERLMAVAREEDALLAVAGSSGHRSLQAWLVGSVTRELVKSLDRPLVVVPPGATPPGRGAPVRTLVCGVDASEESDRAMALASRLARAGPSTGGRPRLRARRVGGHDPCVFGHHRCSHQQLQRMAKRDAARVLERAEAVAGTDLAVQPRLLVGDPAERLSDLAARDRRRDDRGGLARARVLRLGSAGVLGSELIANSPVPVVITTGRVP